MQNAVAFSNNDVITIAWSYGKKPVGCMGFAIYRIDDKNIETPLPSQAVFKGQKKTKGQTTKDFPIQKFYWKDVYARLEAEKTKNTGKIYAVLYELGDEELLQKLEGLGDRLNIILSDAKGKDDDDTKPEYKAKDGKMKYHQKNIDNNQAARDRLKETTNNKWDRIMPNNHIGHNKFLVYTDNKNNPKSVLLGSTNWTSTGLCTQTNNSLIIDDVNLAKRYLDYWKKLKEDDENADGDP